MRLENVVEDRFLALFLGLERLGIVEHLTVPVPEDVRRIPAGHAEQPGLETRCDHRLDQRLTRLQVLARHRGLGHRRQREQRRDVRRQVRRCVAEGNAFAQRGVCVDHARRDLRIAHLERLLERLHRRVLRSRGPEDLRTPAPDHHQSIQLMIRLESADVVRHLVREIALVPALLDVGTAETLDVVRIEDGRPRADGLELGPDLVEQRRLEHTRRLGGGIAVFFEDVPAAKHEVVQCGERHRVLDLWRAAFRALAQADGSHLGERADGPRQPFANRIDAGNGGGAHGPEADQQNAQFALGWGDVNGWFHNRKLYHYGDANRQTFSAADSTSTRQMSIMRGASATRPCQSFERVRESTRSRLR